MANPYSQMADSLGIILVFALICAVMLALGVFYCLWAFYTARVLMAVFMIYVAGCWLHDVIFER